MKGELSLSLEELKERVKIRQPKPARIRKLKFYDIARLQKPAKIKVNNSFYRRRMRQIGKEMF